MKKLLAAIAFAALPAIAQTEDPAALIAAQRDAMRALSFMDGVWRGPARIRQANGEELRVTQTERIGPFLDGSVKVIEGRGYRENGQVGFNALGIISYDVSKKAYSMRAYAQGRSGDFEFVPRPDGYQWFQRFPGFTIRYTATVGGGKFREVGERIVEGREPQQFFEMNLERIGDTDWPGANPIPRQ